MINCLLFVICYSWLHKNDIWKNFTQRREGMLPEMVDKNVTFNNELCHCQIIWYLFAGFKVWAVFNVYTHIPILIYQLDVFYMNNF